MLALFLFVGSQASAQTTQNQPIVLDDVEKMSFDRPESWAMKYFASAAIPTGLGTPSAREKGSITIGIEGGHVPSLDEDQRRVGFIGSKVEDLNRTSLFGRLRVMVGLPRNYSLTVGLVPPVELEGVTPEFFALALGRPVLASPAWRLGLRTWGQVGSIKGDLTCPGAIAGLADPRLNPDGCLAPSRDRVSQNSVGLELSAAATNLSDRWEPHVALAVNYLDLEFQVGARYSIFLDQAVLRSDGFTYSIAAGLGGSLTDGVELVGELFYSPLDVVRDPTLGAQNDALFNARFLLTHRAR
jgi:hypothetical protein